MDWRRFDADPDPNFHVDADPGPDLDWHQNDEDPIQSFTNAKHHFKIL